MAAHFVHVSKAGGTAVRHALREARRAAGGELLSPWGEVVGHRHGFRLHHLPDDDKAFFALRDPIPRFLSGFYSRLRQGAPRYLNEWSEVERQSFEWFATPQELADALAEAPGERRSRAEFAMQSIRHVKRPLTFWTGRPNYLRKHLDRVLYIARQETLDEDWERLKELLELPDDLDLPRDDVAAHRTSYPDDRAISPEGLAALRAWYARDYEVLEIAEEVRRGRGPQRSRRARFPKLRGLGS